MIGAVGASNSFNQETLLVKTLHSVPEVSHCITTEAPGDYLTASGLLVFNTGDSEQCHSIQIVDDEYCDPGQFFSNLALVAGAPVITVDPPKAEIIILDSDCGEQKLIYYCS